MNKNIALIFSCLMLSTPVLADRPAMDERPAMEERPAAMESPMPTDEMESRPAASAVEMEMQQQQEMEQQKSVQVESGDVLEMQPGETIPVRLLDFPRRGMTMDKVKNELGEPLTTSPAVGDPPITSWTYSDRIVYFEYSTVLHVVANR